MDQFSRIKNKMLLRFELGEIKFTENGIITTFSNIISHNYYVRQLILLALPD